MKASDQSKQVTITMTYKQFILLEHATEFMARTMEGQLCFTIQELMEEAYDRRYKQEHPDYPTNKLAPGWYEVREMIEDHLQRCREIVWDLPQSGPSLYRYQNNRIPQTYWDMYQCLRYARYLDMPDADKEDCRYTCVSNTPLKCGDEPFIKVDIIDHNTTP